MVGTTGSRREAEPRASRLHRTVAALATASLVTLAACSQTQSQDPRRTPESEPAVTCAGESEATCGTVRVGSQTFRFIKAGSSSGAGATLVDLGGPGSAAPTARQLESVRSRLPPAIRTQRLIEIQEPWVTRPVTTECARSLEIRYEKIRRGRPEDPSIVVGRCGLDRAGRWGFAPGQYADILRAVEEQTGARFSAFVGASFAAQRLTYLNGFHLDTVALSHPFPVGAEAARYLQQRGSAADRHWSAAYRATAPLPRTFTTGSAVLASAYLGKADITKLSTLSKSELDGRLEDLRDGLWQIFGMGSVSPAALAYYDEACPALHAWDKVAPTSGTTTRDILTRYHDLCAAVVEARAHGGESPAGLAGYPGATCVLVSRQDAVIPARLLRESIVTRRADQIIYDAGEHQSLGELDRCAGHR